MMNIDTAFNDCNLVDLFEEGAVVAKIHWGTILVDPSGRWDPGDYVRTSPIISDYGDGLFSTYNSTCLSMGTVTHLILLFEFTVQIITPSRGGRCKIHLSINGLLRPLVALTYSMHPGCQHSKRGVQRHVN